jgi:hypothetical protein
MLKLYSSFSLIGACCLFFTDFSFAQNYGDLFLSTGIQPYTIRDQGFSPIKYKGNTSVSSIGFLLGNENRTELYQGDFSFGILANQAGLTMNEISIGFTSYTFYHKEKDATQGLHLGWSNKNRFNIRSHNEFTNYNYRYDYYSVIGPAARFILPFQWKNKFFVWENIANWHLLGIQIKSGYIGAEPENYKDDNSLIDNFFATVKPFLPLENLDLGFSSAVFWKLPATNNRLGLRYQFNYGKLSGIRSIYRYGQAVDVVLNVKLW